MERERAVAAKKNFLSVKEVAEFLNLPPRTVYDLCLRGEVPCVRLGRRVLIPRKVLLKKLGFREEEISPS